MRKTYKKLRKAGTRIAAVRRVAESIQVNPNFDFNPFILEPEASTVIKRNIKKHMNKKAYTRATVTFHTNLVLFKNVLTAFNANDNSKTVAKNRLLKSIPVGRTLEAFLEVPGTADSITRLRTILSDTDFIFPERDTTPYIELKGLVDEILNLITYSLQGRITIPLTIQRQERVGMLPTGALASGQGRKNKSRRNKRRK
jgi:hypothetical protein